MRALIKTLRTLLIVALMLSSGIAQSFADPFAPCSSGLAIRAFSMKLSPALDGNYDHIMYRLEVPPSLTQKLSDQGIGGADRMYFSPTVDTGEQNLLQAIYDVGHPQSEISVILEQPLCLFTTESGEIEDAATTAVTIALGNQIESQLQAKLESLPTSTQLAWELAELHMMEELALDEGGYADVEQSFFRECIYYLGIEECSALGAQYSSESQTFWEGARQAMYDGAKVGGVIGVGVGGTAGGILGGTAGSVVPLAGTACGVGIGVTGGSILGGAAGAKSGAIIGFGLHCAKEIGGPVLEFGKECWNLVFG